MKDTLAAGLTATRRLTVDAARSIDFMGEDLRVYATPSIVNDVEHVCRDLLLDHLEDGEDSVGARIEIDHLVPTPLGMEARVTATIMAIDGKRVTLEFTVDDATERVARGSHVRVVVAVDRLTRHIAAKKATACAPD